MSEKRDLNAGRLYKIVRDTLPKILGSRTCPNCHREKPNDHFQRVKRGRAWTWLCNTCCDSRRPPSRV